MSDRAPRGPTRAREGRRCWQIPEPHSSRRLSSAVLPGPPNDVERNRRWRAGFERRGRPDHVRVGRRAISDGTIVDVEILEQLGEVQRRAGEPQLGGGVFLLGAGPEPHSLRIKLREDKALGKDGAELLNVLTLGVALRRFLALGTRASVEGRAQEETINTRLNSGHSNLRQQLK